LPKIPKGINHCYFCYLASEVHVKGTGGFTSNCDLKSWIQKFLILYRSNPKLLEHFIEFNTMEEFLRSSFQVNGLGVVGFYSILRLFKNFSKFYPTSTSTSTSTSTPQN